MVFPSEQFPDCQPGPPRTAHCIRSGPVLYTVGCRGYVRLWRPGKLWSSWIPSPIQIKHPLNGPKPWFLVFFDIRLLNARVFLACKPSAVKALEPVIQEWACHSLNGWLTDLYHLRFGGHNYSSDTWKTRYQRWKRNDAAQKLVQGFLSIRHLCESWNRAVDRGKKGRDMRVSIHGSTPKWMVHDGL